MMVVGDLQYIITGTDGPALDDARDLLRGGYLVPIVDTVVREQLGLGPAPDTEDTEDFEI